MNLVCLNLFFSLLFFGCKPINVSLPNEEQNRVIEAAINIEKDSSFGIINTAKYGSYYLLNDRFHDSVFVDSDMIYLIDKSISFQKIQGQYKKALNNSNKLVSDNFNLIHIVEYSNKTPVFLSFSKPIKYEKYYIVNFFYSSWSSGYKSTLLLKESNSGQLKLVYRRVYNLV